MKRDYRDQGEAGSIYDEVKLYRNDKTEGEWKEGRKEAREGWKEAREGGKEGRKGRLRCVLPLITTKAGLEGS